MIKPTHWLTFTGLSTKIKRKKKEKKKKKNTRIHKKHRSTRLSRKWAIIDEYWDPFRGHLPRFGHKGGKVHTHRQTCIQVNCSPYTCGLFQPREEKKKVHLWPFYPCVTVLLCGICVGPIWIIGHQINGLQSSNLRYD